MAPDSPAAHPPTPEPGSPRLTRRTVLAGGVALGAAAAGAWIPAPAAAETPTARRRPGEGKTLLILGGTGFLGPVIVRTAIEAGYTVTLFNRGRTNADLFPDLEKLRGDRDTHDLAALEGRSFDIVVDTSGYVPEHVRRTATLLGPGCERYVFVSSVSAYQQEGEGIRDEDFPVTVLDDEVLASVTKIRESFPHYSGMKAHCETAAEEAAPGKALNIRPGLIVGPGDRSDRFTYWPVRVRRGGEILAPGDPDAHQQFIDVHDLGEWIVRAAAAGCAGAYNAVGFRGRVSMEELLHGAKICLGTECSFTWVPSDFLLACDVGPWQEMPLWIPDGANHYANRKAIEAGLTFRPIAETIITTADWHAKDRPGHGWPRTLSPTKETRVLGAWRDHLGKQKL